MLLTLPFHGLAIALPVPTASWFVNGARVNFHPVTPVTAEVEALAISNCTDCGSITDRQIQCCREPTCPAKARRAA